MFRIVPFLLCLAAGCAKPATPAATVAAPTDAPAVVRVESLFADVTAASGVAFTVRNGEEGDFFTLLETLPGGVGIIDYDGDGLPDLFVCAGGYFEGAKDSLVRGHPWKLYRNLGGMKFADVTAEVGMAEKSPFYSMGVAVTDYDRDGWPDLLVTGYGGLALYRNEPGAGGKGRRFRNVTAEAGLNRTDGLFSTSAAFADLDGDGFPDLYLCRYADWSFDKNHPVCKGYANGIDRDVCSPKQFLSDPHVVYRNLGDGKFEDVSGTCGLKNDPTRKNNGKGLGVLAVDVNRDGRPDLYVANDTTDNFLYLNLSEKGKIVLKEVGFEQGVACDSNGTANGSMGVDAADWDESGRPSIFVTNYEYEFHALYRNLTMAPDKLGFNYATTAAGIGAIGPYFVSFGTGFVDVDLDGHEDLVICSGHVVRYPTKGNLAQRQLVLKNVPRNGSRFFEEVRFPEADYMDKLHRGRGMAVADFDNDGKSDLAFTNVNEPLALLRGITPASNWLGIELVGKAHADYVGARLTLEVGGRKLVRFAKGGGSFLSANDRRIAFGLGDAKAVGSLTVEWPHGRKVQKVVGLAAGKYHRIEEE